MPKGSRKTPATTKAITIISSGAPKLVLQRDQVIAGKIPSIMATTMVTDAASPETQKEPRDCA